MNRMVVREIGSPTALNYLINLVNSVRPAQGQKRLSWQFWPWLMVAGIYSALPQNQIGPESGVI